MGLPYEQIEAKEKKARKGLMKDLLKAHNLKDEDVKTMKKDSEYAISILELEDGMEKIALWKRIDASPTFRITVDYDFTFEDNPKDRRNRKERRKANET